MVVSEITLTPVARSRAAQERTEEFAQLLYGALNRGGQCTGTPVLSWEKGRLTMRLPTPGPDALERQHLTREAAELIAGGKRRWKIGWRAPAPQKRPADWGREKALFLFTHAFDDASPICGGKRGDAIPLYRLPLSDGLRQELGAWAHEYRLFDELWLASDALERQAYLQLSSVTSSLNRRGRRLAVEVATATRRPTWYFLHRYYAKERGEESRRCPVCGKKWRVEPTERPFHGLGGFEFRCQRCMLLSVHGVEKADWVR
jgi:hypothetical protein